MNPTVTDGDYHRRLREGVDLACKAIEDFAEQIELAVQGLIDNEELVRLLEEWERSIEVTIKFGAKEADNDKSDGT
jgi:hypothetical protein